MKKILAAICALCAVVSLAAFAACDGNGDETSVERTAPTYVDITASIAFTATSDVMTISEDTSTKDYLDALAAAGQITYEGYETDYGYYITSVNGLSEVSNTCYWFVYTDLFTLDGVTYATTDYGSYDYNGTTLGSASYGVSSLPCVEGYSYALVYTTYIY